MENSTLQTADTEFRKDDEHPWCLICLITANIPPKCGRSCYICAVMSETAISNRTILAEKYLGEIKEHGKITTAATLIRSDIHTQMEADLAEEERPRAARTGRKSGVRRTKGTCTVRRASHIITRSRKGPGLVIKQRRFAIS